jgi:hypothetical protein
MLFLIGLLVVASGYMSLRPQIMGLALHPSLVPIALAFPITALSRLGLIPIRIVASLVLFVTIYCFSIINGASFSLSEMFKVVAAGITVLTCAMLIRRRGDFVAGVLGLTLGVAWLAAPALANDAAAGVDLMDGANKNAYSLYALPSLLYAGFICTRWKTVPNILKLIMLGGMFLQLTGIFLSGNRSGYLGAVIVAGMLFWDQKGKGLLLGGALAIAVAAVLIVSGRTEVFDRRMEQTVDGNKSDDLRIEIIQSCIELMMENPVIGVSPQKLHAEIARKVQSINRAQIDSHNVFAHVGAASGIFCFASLMALGWALWTVAPGIGKLAKTDPLYAPRRLMQMTVALWVIRGLFTREILYNPAFCIVLGLGIGLCVLAMQERKSLSEQQPTTWPTPNPV